MLQRIHANVYTVLNDDILLSHRRAIFPHLKFQSNTIHTIIIIITVCTNYLYNHQTKIFFISSHMVYIVAWPTKKEKQPA